jgi:hypothetical protein
MVKRQEKHKLYDIDIPTLCNQDHKGWIFALVKIRHQSLQLPKVVFGYDRNPYIHNLLGIEVC